MSATSRARRAITFMTTIDSGAGSGIETPAISTFLAPRTISSSSDSAPSTISTGIPLGWCRASRTRLDSAKSRASSIRGTNPSCRPAARNEGHASRSMSTRTSMSSVRRGRPRIEAATPPMMAPGAAVASSQSDTAPSARTSGAGGTCRPPPDLRSANLGPSERHPSRPYGLVLRAERLLPPHPASRLHQRRQSMQPGFHGGGPKLVDEPPVGESPALPVPRGGFRGYRPVSRIHAHHCNEGGSRAPEVGSAPVPGPRKASRRARATAMRCESSSLRTETRTGEFASTVRTGGTTPEP